MIQQQLGNNYRLLTYNIFMRPSGISHHGQDYKDQRLKDIINRIDKYDIICFQQLFAATSFRAQRLIQSAISLGINEKQLGFKYWKQGHLPYFFDGPVVDSGLLVISKLPIIQSSFHSYKIGVLSDGAADKGVVYCKIQLKKSILHLFNTHLQASYLEGDEQDYCLITRLSQLKILRQVIQDTLVQQKYSNDEIIILAGDLNIDSNKERIVVKNHNLYQKFRLPKQFNQYDTFLEIFQKGGIFLSDIFLEKYFKHPTTFGQKDQSLTLPLDQQTYQCLDYIFQVTFLERKKSKTKIIKQSIKVQQYKVLDKPYQQLSDHYGLSLSFTD